MFGTFRKHSKWLWGIIIAATTVSLVIWTGNPSANGDARGPADHGTIGGKKISSTEFANAFNQARIEYFFSRQGQEWPSAESEKQGFNPTFEAYRHLFFNYKMKEMGIHVSDEEIQKVAAQNLKGFGGPSGSLTSEVFEKEVLARGGVNLADYERFLRSMIGRQQLVAAITVGGQLVSTKDARAIYEREHQEITAQVAFFSASNFISSVNATSSVVAEFYTNRMAQYRLPERIQISYVEFKATNFWEAAAADMAKSTNLNAQLKSIYERQGGTNYYPELTPAQAMETIRSEMHQNQAVILARNSAAKFVTPLLEPGVKAAALNESAQKEGYTVKVSSAFDAQTGPAELNVNEAFVRASFDLREDEPIIGPIITRDAVYVIARNKQIPSENPPFETVRERVTSDYKMMSAARAAQTAAIALVQSATNMPGKAFSTLCTEVGATAVTLPIFSMSTNYGSLALVDEHMSAQNFKEIAARTEVGKVNGMPTYTGGGVVYVISKNLQDAGATMKSLPAFTTQLRQARQEEAFRKWFESEAPKVLADTPIVQRQSQVGAPGQN